MKGNIQKRLEDLRQAMRRENITAYLVVTEDFHGSEYVDDYFKCREYLSGFTGSAGTLVILPHWAGLWTDGRYFLQAENQLQGTGIELMRIGDKNIPTIAVFLAENLQNSDVLGYDGRTVCVSLQNNIRKALESQDLTGISFRTDVDLVGEQWQNRPPFPHGKIWSLGTEYAGQSREDKIALLRQKMKENGTEYLLVTTLDDIAWLLNLRGSDIAYNPVFMSYILMDSRNLGLYVSPEAVSADLKQELTLSDSGICLHPYLDIYEDLKELPDYCLLQIDEHEINAALRACIPMKVKVLVHNNPIRGMKACKNQTEMKNIRKAHVMDGVAVTRLLYYLDTLKNTEAFRLGNIRELDIAEKLLEYRKENEGFLDESFSPIIASGENGAVIHYDPQEGGNSPLKPDTFLLMDTGAQYLCGTTDITRTVALGELTYEMKRHYTAVLRGNLNLAAARFKEGTSGQNLDALARMPLWDLGLDYNHGTGHGVGYVLNVHEGPQSIRGKDSPRDGFVALHPGMLTSDEPGVYLAGQYGIRLENLMLCVPDGTTEYGDFCRFETVTLVPFDRRAILVKEMEPREVAILNEYHTAVYETIAPYLNDDEKMWLGDMTAPL